MGSLLRRARRQALALARLLFALSLLVGPGGGAGLAARDLGASAGHAEPISREVRESPTRTTPIGSIEQRPRIGLSASMSTETCGSSVAIAPVRAGRARPPARRSLAILTL